MSSLEWVAKGIEQALAAGGVELEVYRRPGFTGQVAVRRVQAAGGCGFDAPDPEPDDDER